MKKYLCLILPLLVISCASENQNQNNQGQGVIPAVEAVESQYGSLPLVERFSGNVVSENQVQLFPEVSAKVSQVFVENGDYVQKGDLLVKLEDEPFQKQLQQAEAGLKINKARLKQADAQLKELEAQYKRIQTLADKDLSSQLEIEQIEAQKVSAEADVELAQAQVDQSEALVEERANQLSRTSIKAPVTGTVGQRNAQPGMQATPSTSLFMIGDLSKLRVEIVLTENMLNRIKVGQTAAITLERESGDDIVIDAKLSRISPFLNEVTRSTEAEIDVENQGDLLKPGMYVPVDIFYGESQQATLIPTSAIFIDPQTGNQGIYIANSIGSEIQPVSDSSSEVSSLTEPTEMTFQEIQVIAEGKLQVAVADLEPGKWIITLGQNLLSEGRTQARVKTVPWNHVMKLQQMQREDLLNEVMQNRNQSPAPSGTSL